MACRGKLYFLTVEFLPVLLHGKNANSLQLPHLITHVTVTDQHYHMTVDG